VLGCAVERGDVELMLNRLGLELRAENTGWQVVPPSYRFDLTIEEDLIEEVGRMLGYDSIPATPAYVAARLGRKTETRVALDAVSACLVERGYHEIVTYTFVDATLDAQFSPGGARIELANPIASDMSVMRRSLWPGLIAAARKNLAHQMDDLRLFETGPQFDDSLGQMAIVAGLATGMALPEQWSVARREIDFYDIKGDVEAMLQLTGAGEEFRFESGSHPALRPGQTARISRNGKHVGWVGALHPRLQKELDLKQPVYLFAFQANSVLDARVPKFELYSRLPYIRRDIAVVVDETVEAGLLLDTVRKCAGALLQDVVLFDVYRGKGIDATRKSVALGLILHDASRTLTDDDADGVVRSVTQSLKRDIGATIRT
jgi:phenylalanyl-tRNA synthetase beta chain